LLLRLGLHLGLNLCLSLRLLLQLLLNQLVVQLLLLLGCRSARPRAAAAATAMLLLRWLHN